MWMRQRLRGEVLIARSDLGAEKQALAQAMAQRDEAVRALQSSASDSASLAVQVQDMARDWQGAEARWAADAASLRDQLRSKDDELERTFDLCTDLNKQRGLWRCTRPPTCLPSPVCLVLPSPQGPPIVRRLNP
jgi:hypothetical protein